MQVSLPASVVIGAMGTPVDSLPESVASGSVTRRFWRLGEASGLRHLGTRLDQGEHKDSSSHGGYACLKADSLTRNIGVLLSRSYRHVAASLGRMVETTLRPGRGIR
jgi:hypothetical protein